MISVVMPVLNGEKYLERALDSLEKQGAEYELLVCDGGSTDGTLDILRRRNILPVSVKDLVWAEGMNNGIAQSRGDVIIQFSSDDELLKDGLKNLQEFFDKNNPTWVYAPCVLDYGDYKGMMGNDPNVTLEKMLTGNKIAGISVAFRPEFFRKCGLYNTSFKYANDYELWLRAFCLNILPTFMPTKFVTYKAHSNNLGFHPDGARECEVLKAHYRKSHEPI